MTQEREDENIKCRFMPLMAHQLLALEVIWVHCHLLFVWKHSIQPSDFKGWRLTLILQVDLQCLSELKRATLACFDMSSLLLKINPLSEQFSLGDGKKQKCICITSQGTRHWGYCNLDILILNDVLVNSLHLSLSGNMTWKVVLSSLLNVDCILIMCS